MRLKLISTSKVVFDGEIDMVVLHAMDGEMGVMNAHMDMISELKSGEVRIYKDDNVEKYKIKGGIVSIYDGAFVDVMLA